MLSTYYTSDTSGQLKQNSGSRRLHFYEKGEYIPLLPSGVWQVYCGVVQLSQLPVEGEEILLGWVQSKAFFGPCFTQIDNYEAKALSDVYLKWYDLHEIENSSELSKIILQEIITRGKQIESLLAIAGIRRVEERLQQLLKLLKQEMGEPVQQGTRLAVRFTHQNLANTIGTTRVTVTRLLGEFQKQGWITLDGDRHIILLEKFC